MKAWWMMSLLWLSTAAWAQDAYLKALAESPQWLRLGHYQSQMITGVKSSVTSSDFFLSQSGPSDPHAELQATLDAFLFGSTSTICRFPARYQFLQQRKLVSARNLADTCPEYEQYLSQYPVNEVSVVYAAGFLGNPASMFGHLLLRLKLNNNARLLDNTFNFGAMVPPQDNKLTYIFQGITGGYEARFSDEPFYHHSHVYNEDELRNLWEYSLSLTPKQIQLLLAHRYELQNVVFDYYFFTENCAFQLAELLELVSNKSILSTKYPWVLPYDVISSLADNHPDLVTKVERTPSRQQQFYDRYAQLTAAQQEHIRAFVRQETPLDRLLKDESFTSRNQILDVLLDYFCYLEVRHDGLTEVQAIQRKQVLLQRFTLPAGLHSQWSDVEAVPPHATQKPSLLQIVHRADHRNQGSTEVRIRGNYYDELSINERENNFSALQALDLTISDREKNGIKRLGLVEIRHIKPDQTDLIGDKGLSWSFGFGLRPASNACQNCTVGYMDGGIGKAYGTDETVVYGLITGRVQTAYRALSYTYLGSELGVITKPTRWWRTKVTAKWETGLEQSNHDQDMVVTWEQALGASPDWDVRTSLSSSRQQRWSLKMGYYW